MMFALAHAGNEKQNFYVLEILRTTGEWLVEGTACDGARTAAL